MTFLERLRNGRPMILDAAMGTALLALGSKPREAPRGSIRELHLAQLIAGADIVLTNTFAAEAPEPDAVSAAIVDARRTIEETDDKRYITLSLFADTDPKGMRRACAIATEQDTDVAWLETSMDPAKTEASL